MRKRTSLQVPTGGAQATWYWCCPCANPLYRTLLTHALHIVETEEICSSLSLTPLSKAKKPPHLPRKASLVCSLIKTVGCFAHRLKFQPHLVQRSQGKNWSIFYCQWSGCHRAKDSVIINTQDVKQMTYFRGPLDSTFSFKETSYGKPCLYFPHLILLMKYYL